MSLSGNDDEKRARREAEVKVKNDINMNDMFQQVQMMSAQMAEINTTIAEMRRGNPINIADLRRVNQNLRPPIRGQALRAPYMQQGDKALGDFEDEFEKIHQQRRREPRGRTEDDNLSSIKMRIPRAIDGHTCNKSYQHTEVGTGVSWDDAVHLSAHNFEHITFNLFTCNGHSFAAHFLNRLSYGGSMDWNMVNVWALILSKGQWVDGSAILRSFVPFIVILCYGVLMLGWPFLVIMLSFFLLIAGWHLLITYCFKNLDDDED